MFRKIIMFGIMVLGSLGLWKAQSPTIIPAIAPSPTVIASPSPATFPSPTPFDLTPSEKQNKCVFMGTDCEFGQKTAGQSGSFPIVGSTVFQVWQGGTGFSSARQGELITGSADHTLTLSKLATGSTGQVLTISGGLPTWQTPTVQTPYTGLAMHEGSNPAIHATDLQYDAGGFRFSNTASSGFLFLDYVNGPASRSIAQTISGKWDFTASPVGLTVTNSASISNNLEVSHLASLSAGLVNGYMDFRGLTVEPGAPAAGYDRLHAVTFHGFTQLEQDNEAATDVVYGRDNIFVVKNTTASTITKGQLVYVTGSTGNVANVGLAKADNMSTMKTVGIAANDITAGSFGQVMFTGLLDSFNTSAFNTGDEVWVSSSSAGGLTNHRPRQPYLVQAVGQVLVSGIGNGSLLVNISHSIGQQDTGTIANGFTIGTVATPSFLSVIGPASVSGNFEDTGTSILGSDGGVYITSVGAGNGTIGFNSGANTGNSYAAGVTGAGFLMQYTNSDSTTRFYNESSVTAGQGHAHTTILTVNPGSQGATMSVPFEDTSYVSMSTGYVTNGLNFTNTTTPSTPPAGVVTIYGQSAASGVTRLNMLTATGATLAFFRDMVDTVRNNTGSQINKGSVVYINGSNGTTPTVALAQANSATTAADIGVALANISTNAFGTVQRAGSFTGINTGTFAQGDTLWVDATTPGAVTNVQPTAPNFAMRVGTVVTSNANGTVDLFIQPFVPSKNYMAMVQASVSAAFEVGTYASVSQLYVGQNQQVNLRSAGASLSVPIEDTAYVSSSQVLIGQNQQINLRAAGASLSVPFEDSIYASASKYFGATLSSCTGTNFLQWTGGLFSCAAAPAAGGSFTGLLMHTTPGATTPHITDLNYQPNSFVFANVASAATLNLNWGTSGVASRSAANTWSALNVFSLSASISPNLEVSGGYASISNVLFTQNNGNVGIGKTSPTAKLDISGSASVSGNFSVGSVAPGDAVTAFGGSGSTASWSLGVQDTDADAFHISRSLTLGTNDFLRAVATGATVSVNFEVRGNASASKNFGAGLVSCTGSNALQWTGGLFSCAAISGATSLTSYTASGSQTYTVPAGVTFIKVVMYGGGGGGGGGQAVTGTAVNKNAGAGGGGAFRIERTYRASDFGPTVSVVIGGGGTGGTAGATGGPGGIGGTSTFGTVASAYGGGGGEGGAAGARASGGGGGACDPGTSGSTTTGGTGGCQSANTNTFASGDQGGNGVNTNTAPMPAVSGGAGGGGTTAAAAGNPGAGSLYGGGGSASGGSCNTLNTTCGAGGLGGGHAYGTGGIGGGTVGAAANVVTNGGTATAGNGGPGTAGSSTTGGGGGGGGGAAGESGTGSTIATGGIGGHGGLCGGAGGGGGAAGTTSGTGTPTAGHGGNGGDGCVFIMAW